MTREESIEIVAQELGVKPVGNMVWFMDTEQAPRQLTKVERKLFEYIINENIRKELRNFDLCSTMELFKD